MTQDIIETAFLDFYNRKTELEDNIKEFVRVILKETPEHIISFVEDAAYCIDGFDCAEIPIYGIRLDDTEESMEICVEKTQIGDDYEPDWSDGYNVRSEFNHHCTINWISILDSIRFAYRKYE